MLRTLLATGIASVIALTIPQTVIAKTKRIAQVTVKNGLNRNIESVTIVHKYSDVYKKKQTWGAIGPGKTSPKSMPVRYHTGIGTTGQDWWYVTWKIEGEDKLYHTVPNNFRNIIDKLEGALSKLVGTIGSTVAGDKASIVTDKVAGALFNTESTVGFKKHFLEKEDQASGLAIIITAGSVKFISASGKSSTEGIETMPLPAGFSAPGSSANASAGGKQSSGKAVRIQNLWKKDQFLNTANGRIASSRIAKTDSTANWVLAPVSGKNGQFRIQNKSNDTQFIHIETGKVTAGKASPNWWSARWKLVSVDNAKKIYRIQNVWKPKQYLHIENGSLKAGPISNNWYSARWVIK